MSALSQTENEKKFIELIKSFYIYIRSQEDGDLLIVNKLLLHDNILQRVEILFSVDSPVLHNNITMKIRRGKSSIVLDPNITIDQFYETLRINLNNTGLILSELNWALSNLDKRITKLQENYKSEQNSTKKQQIKEEVRENLKKKIVEQKKFEKKKKRAFFLRKIYDDVSQLIEIFNQEADKFESTASKEEENICPGCGELLEEESKFHCVLCGHILNSTHIEITHILDLIETEVLKLLTHKREIRSKEYEQELIEIFKKFEKILIIILSLDHRWISSGYIIDGKKNEPMAKRWQIIADRIRKNVIYVNKENLNIQNKILLEIHNYLLYIQTTVYPGDDDLSNESGLVNEDYNPEERLDSYNIASKLNKFEEANSAARKRAEDLINEEYSVAAPVASIKKKKKKKKKKKSRKKKNK